MERKYIQNQKKTQGSVLIPCLILKLIFCVFFLTFLNAKKTNEKIYRLHELYSCHKSTTKNQMDYLSKQEKLNTALEHLAILKKIPHLKKATIPLIQICKTSQEVLYVLHNLSKLRDLNCTTSFLDKFNSDSILKRKVLFQRDKKSQAILYRKRSQQIICSKYINYKIKTIYTKGKKSVSKRSRILFQSIQIEEENTAKLPGSFHF